MSMSVSVVQVRIVWVRMHHGLMLMQVRMRFAPIPWKVVCVLMVHIMDMKMFVSHCLMRMRVVVAFTDMQPHAQGHQRAGDPESRSGRFTQ